MLARLLELAVEADQRVLGRISVRLQPLAEAGEHERLEVIEDECLHTLERAGMLQSIVLEGDPRLLGAPPESGAEDRGAAAQAAGGD